MSSLTICRECHQQVSQVAQAIQNRAKRQGKILRLDTALSFACSTLMKKFSRQLDAVQRKREALLTGSEEEGSILSPRSAQRIEKYEEEARMLQDKINFFAVIKGRMQKRDFA